MTTPVADPVKLALQTLSAVAPTPRQLWPYGPALMPAERKNSCPYLGQYVAWVAEVERNVGDIAEAAQRLRALYYGAAAGNAPFDALLDTSLTLGPPLTTKHAVPATLTGLAATGILATSADGIDYARPPVDVSHVWVGLDAGLNGLGMAGHGLRVSTDPVAALTWLGDLASWWTSYNDAKIKARQVAIAAGRTWSEPTDAASLATPLGWLNAATAARCAVDDLFGDMDAQILRPEADHIANPMNPAPLATLLRLYYQPDPAAVDRRLVSSVNRFHLFIDRATPAIPHTINPATGVVTIDPVAVRAMVRAALETTTFDLLTLGRFKGSWKLYVADAVIRGLPGAVGGLIDSVRADISSPWGQAMLDEIAKRFTDFLVAGLAGNGWTTGGWPQYSTDPAVTRRKRWPLERYGNFALRYGDNDAARRYGGRAAAVTTAQTYVRNLQEDLLQLGFTVVGTPDGGFGARTAYAVRELQIEAQDTAVWQETAVPPATSAVPAVYRHRGPVNGVVDWDTAEVIAHWIDPANALRNRCPTTVEAHALSSLPPLAADPGARSLWLYDDMQSTTLRVFSVDGLDRFPIPLARQITGAPGTMAIGAFSTEGTHGPVLDSHQWWRPEAQVTMTTLLPPALVPAPPVDPKLAPVSSTYRVVRAVAEVECQGNFDVYNAWDAGIVSFGVDHWALLSSGTGELAAMLAHYQSLDPDAYQRDFGRYGILPAVPWDPAVYSGGGGGAQSKYVGQLGMYGLTDADGKLHAADLLPLDRATDPYMINYMRSWHVINRVVMALRRTSGIRQSFWAMAVRRLREVLARPWDSRTVPNPGPVVPVASGGTRVATLGEVFTSEQAVAALLRYHVNRPQEVLNSNGATGITLQVFQNVFGTGQVNMTTANTTARQQALVTGYINKADTDWYKTSVVNAVGYVDANAGALSATLGSFSLLPA